MADAVAEPDAVDRQRRDDRRRVRAIAERSTTETLELEPHAVDAMLGKVARADVSRPQRSRRSRPTDQLIARALVRRRRALLAGAQRKRARTQRGGLGRHRGGGEAVGQRAGAEARRPDRLSPAAAGVSRAKFDESRTPQSERLRNRASISASCWRSSERGRATADVLLEAATLPRGQRRARTCEEIASIQASSEPPARKAAKIARREQYIAKARRQIATSWFNIAVAYYNLSRRSEARQFAEKVADDEQFGERARELMARCAIRAAAVAVPVS